MFARKKPQDFQSSLHRFADLTRDNGSRVKHFKLVFEGLNLQERKQLVEGFSFEIFHLMNSLITSHYGQPIEQQTLTDVESALWIMEQVFLNSPELIAKGWQRNGIECLMRMVLHPKNVTAVRRLAIRLFIIWYQILGASGQMSTHLDIIFQSCSPHFPLRNGQSTEQILTVICEGSLPSTSASNNAYGFEPAALRCIPLVSNIEQQPPQQSQSIQQSSYQQQTLSTKVDVRERAQTLQMYLDKFFEYITREVTKINWTNPQQQLECAKFLLDRIIVLYIYELFPESEANGIDIYNGWESTFEEDGSNQLFDTTDPTIIAKYWLIRWITNVAFESQLSKASNSNGLDLFKQALFSFQKATNILLTLTLREAFRLPLSCINVIQKVLSLIKLWLFQQEIPPFVESQMVSHETWTLLLIRMLFSFFRSPYLLSVGDKLPSAITLTHTILQIIRNLANPSCIHLSRPLTKTIWQEIIRELLIAVETSICKSDGFGQATTAGFTRTLLSVLIFVRIICEIQIDDIIWDDVLVVLKNAVWKNQVIEQWAQIVPNLTRALILNLFTVEMGSRRSSDMEKTHQQLHGSVETTSSDGSQSYQPSRTAQSSDVDSVPDTYLCEAVDGDSKVERLVSSNSGEYEIQGVIQQSGNVITWLRAWMRVVSLVDSTTGCNDQRSYSALAVQTLGHSIDMLIKTGSANSIIHWLTSFILRIKNVAEQPHAIPIICNVLILANPPSLLRAYILNYLIDCLRIDDVGPIVFQHIPSMDLEDMAIISAETIATLQKLVKNQEFSSRAIRVAALLSLQSPEAEKILISLLEQRQVQIDQISLNLCINALCLLILERADVTLFDHLLHILVSHQNASTIMPIFCSNLGYGFNSQLVDALIIAQSKVTNTNTLNDIKWQLCVASLPELITPHWNALAEKFHSSNDEFFESFMISYLGQYPIPGFQITQWNSLPPIQQHQQQCSLQIEEAHNNTYIETPGSILNFDKSNQQILWSRNCLVKHSYQIEHITNEQEKTAHIDNWLKLLSEEETFQSQYTPSARKKSSPIDELFDPFQDLPRPSVRFYASTSNIPNAELTPLDISAPEMFQFIQGSSRSPEERRKMQEMENKLPEEENDGNEKFSWRPFIASFGFLDNAKNPPGNFAREIRHLDSTICREVHKIAVIYVGKDQQDKQTILSNNNGSENFNKFVDALGWPVQIGSPDFVGYTGGLSNGQIAPYYANANTELIFHVSTLLNGDKTQRLKHLGNDEVHVVWSENSKPYKRDTIATRFCDILIVLYVVSPLLLRVHIEVQDQRIQFGPLFDGACVHTLQAASLIRETVLNASRAYRNLRTECDRPNKHREKVFKATKEKLGHMQLSSKILRLFSTLE